MQRQFYRLYILIIGSCALIVWSFNLLYTAIEEDDYAYSIDVDMIFDAIHQKPLLTELPTNQIAFSQELLDRLNQGEIVALEHKNDQQYYYRFSSNKLLIQQLGPLYRPKTTSKSTTIWIPLLYGSLALAMLLLISPVFRDLALLQNQAIRFGKQPQRLETRISKRSVIYPLAKGFEKMTNQIMSFLKMHKDLSRIISHEIRTPLSRMRFVLEIIKNDLPAEYKKRLSADIDEIELLTENYLSFARLEHHQLSPQFEWQTAKTFISTLEDKFAIYQDKIALDFEVDCSQSEGKILVEPMSMTLACQNLIVNALHYAKSRIKVTMITSEKHWQFSVEDDGPGFGNQYILLKKAFVRGAQANSSGFGLGLYIVRKIAIWHHGSLKVTPSCQLGGATFTIHWRRTSVD